MRHNAYSLDIHDDRTEPTRLWLRKRTQNYRQSSVAMSRISGIEAPCLRYDMLINMSHCFNYIRQAILCGLDTTLEGPGEGVGVADGTGQLHVCRDNEQSIKQRAENRYIDSQAIA